MPLGLVYIQHLFDLEIQRTVEQGQPFGDVLMYRRLADAEFLRGGPDCGPVFYNVKSQALRPLLHVSLQNILTPCLLLVHPMRRNPGLCASDIFEGFWHSIKYSIVLYVFGCFFTFPVLLKKWEKLILLSQLYFHGKRL